MPPSGRIRKLRSSRDKLTQFASRSFYGEGRENRVKIAIRADLQNYPRPFRFLDRKIGRGREFGINLASSPRALFVFLGTCNWQGGSKYEALCVKTNALEQIEYSIGHEAPSDRECYVSAKL